MAIRVVNKKTGRVADVINQKVINVSLNPPVFQVLYRIGDSLFTRDYEEFWLLYERSHTVDIVSLQTKGFAITQLRDMKVGDSIEVPILGTDPSDNIRNRYLSACKQWNRSHPDDQREVRTRVNRKSSTITVYRTK